MNDRKLYLPTINNKKIYVGIYDEVAVVSFCCKLILSGIQCDIKCEQCALKNEYSYLEYHAQI